MDERLPPKDLWWHKDRTFHVCIYVNIHEISLVHTMYTTRNGFTDTFNLSRLFSEENAYLSFSIDRENRSLDMNIQLGQMEISEGEGKWPLVIYIEWDGE